ncbi:hypothetical protein D9758_009657 [Tetrapyrgos nigripes]|uniref:3'-5' exonuclease domain-containing protein n=1 Tax=Tetrapyrgos nigripes TaxID=182062 RepID=A0A8H5CNZ2_9AGAR|nr:hypothetical protein D9758_009657 [Tetrapyrgos nigripes]
MADTVNHPNYTLCDNERLLCSTVDKLSNASHLAVDLEGANLGLAGGSLSLISIKDASESTSQAYLIDALAFNAEQLRPIYDLLESDVVTKVMYDGRMDYSALYHEKQVSLKKVIDLQLVDIKSRAIRGEGADRQLERLNPSIRRKELELNQRLYTRVQKLVGLGDCLKEHDVPGSKGGVDHNEWMKRPIPASHLQYAASDVANISLLYQKFLENEYLGKVSTEESQRYISMWRDKTPSPSDRYRLHAFLPLNIIEYDYGLTKTCEGCARGLPRSCFSATAWNVNFQELRKTLSRLSCHSCTNAGFQVGLPRLSRI